MTVRSHEASNDVLQSSMATSQENMGSSTDTTPHDKTEPHETSQIGVSENTLQERRPPLGRLLRLRNRSRLAKIAAVVSVTVSLSAILGVAVWAVFSAKEDDLTQGAVYAASGSSKGKITWRLPAFLNRIITSTTPSCSGNRRPETNRTY